MADDAIGVHISAREIYDQIVGMRNDIQRLTSQNEGVSLRIEDHEARLRSLERWKYALPITAVGCIATTITAIWVK